jgi:hypothetical protein
VFTEPLPNNGREDIEREREEKENGEVVADTTFGWVKKFYILLRKFQGSAHLFYW